MSQIEGLISKKEARKFQKRYIKEKLKPLCEKIGFEDGVEFTFPLNRIKDYIEYIETHAKDENYKELGLKICLGAYEKKVSDEGPKTTIFLVPTAKGCGKIKKNKEAKIDEEEDPIVNEENDNIYTLRAMNLGSSGPGKY